LCTQIPIAQHRDDDVMPICEQHSGDVDELARRTLDREPSAVDDWPHVVDDDAPTVSRQSKAVSRQSRVVSRQSTTVDC
jgi:hypothetical protein